MIDAVFEGRPEHTGPLSSAPMGIFVSATANRGDWRNRQDLGRVLRGREVAVSDPDLTAYAVGPEIAIEDELYPPLVACTSSGVTFSNTLRLAVSPDVGAFRRVVYRPVLKVRLLGRRPRFRIDVDWTRQWPGGGGPPTITSKHVAIRR